MQEKQGTVRGKEFNVIAASLPVFRICSAVAKSGVFIHCTCCGVFSCLGGILTLGGEPRAFHTYLVLRI